MKRVSKREFLHILRSVTAQQPTQYPAALKKIYAWASTLTTEAKIEDSKEDFYVTPTVRRLRFKLANINQGLIGLVGLQGSGKTSVLQFLCSEINDLKNPEKQAFLIHWTPDALKVLENEIKVWDVYRQLAYERAYEKAESYARVMKPIGGSVPTLVTLGALSNRSMNISEVEGVLGSFEVRKLKEKSVINFLSEMRYLFIDLPDYSKKHRGDMTRALRAVETLWKTFQYGGYEAWQVMILGIQKEMFGGHFFFGKMDIVEIEPLKPNELVEAYKQKWHTFEVITEDAVFYIAQLSRGVFRRFLKYLQRCIEETVMSKSAFPITTETAKASVTLEQIAKDMDLELADLFKNKEQKLNCVKLLNLLRERGEVNQRQIAEALDVNDMTISRMVKTLEANGYIKRRRAQGAEWLISL